MIDTKVEYAGIELERPFIAGASPVTHDLDVARRLEDAGAAAIVMHSLFEEQLEEDALSTHHHVEAVAHSHAEATSYFPELPEPKEAGAYGLGPEAYLEQLRRLKASLSIPVFGSLNGVSPGGWIRYARSIEEAGADAIELNLYDVPVDPDESAAQVDARHVETVQAVAEAVSIPVAVKLSPFLSAPVHLARRLAEAGAAALVVFNRFYQPDIDVEALEVVPSLKLSTSDELLLRVRWLAAFFEVVPASLAVTGGVHTPIDAIKALMAGASGVQVTSAILARGPSVIADLSRGLVEWLEEHEYASVRQMVGSMSLARCPDPEAFGRANYMKVLAGWRRGSVI
ncbi:MAG: dihydroorotate dehydrogenase-like protein [Deltaproteobacteria bacterium]|nr:MAG: dihydroorotate dehydrogenase-like protein [Deltaproteobacteria bacterium]